MSLTNKARQVAELVERLENAVTELRSSYAFSNIQEADAVNEFIDRNLPQLDLGLDEYLEKLPQIVHYLENGAEKLRGLIAQAAASNPLN